MRTTIGVFFCALSAITAVAARPVKQVQFSSPDERVYFGKEYGKQFSISSRAGGEGSEVIECPLVYQDVAYKPERQKPVSKVTILAYSGCPFNVPANITAVNDVEMRAEVRVLIDSVQDGVFLTQKTDEDGVPFEVTATGPRPGAVMYKNVVWVFAKKMVFSTNTAKYTVGRPGATISFTTAGVKLDGVTRAPVSSPTKKK